MEQKPMWDYAWLCRLAKQKGGPQIIKKIISEHYVQQKELANTKKSLKITLAMLPVTFCAGLYADRLFLKSTKEKSPC